MLKIVSCAALALSLISTPTRADDFSNPVTGKITRYVVGGGINNTVDSRPCVFVKIDNVEQWYAISSSDCNYDAEKDLVLNTYLTGQRIKIGRAHV